MELTGEVCENGRNTSNVPNAAVKNEINFDDTPTNTISTNASVVIISKITVEKEKENNLLCPDMGTIKTASKLDMSSSNKKTISLLSEIVGFEENINGNQIADLENLFQVGHVESGLTCGVCEKIFLTQELLTRHMCRHRIKRRHSCSQCGKEFLTRQHLREHSNVHTGNRPHACPFCKRRFTQRGSCYNHIQTHQTERTFACAECNKTFAQKRLLAEHMWVHFNKTQFVCRLCSKAYQCRKHVRSHVRAMHGGDESCITVMPVTDETKLAIRRAEARTPGRPRLCRPKQALPHICDRCGKKFKRKKDFVVHINKHEGREAYVCDVCHKGFARDDTLRVHKRLHTGEKPYVCTFCLKGFIRKVSLKSHMSHHTVQENDHVCEFCEKRYRTEERLRAHLRIHLKKGAFVCSICQKTCQQVRDLERHMRKHTGDRSFPCKRCGRTFCSESDYRRHLKDGRFWNRECLFCGRKCKTHNIWRTHIENHVAKVIQCTFCSTSAVKGSLLNTHVITYYDTKMALVCGSCQHPSYTEDDLCSHLMSHSSEMVISKLACTVAELFMEILGSESAFALGFHERHLHVIMMDIAEACGWVKNENTQSTNLEHIRSLLKFICHEMTASFYNSSRDFDVYTNSAENLVLTMLIVLRAIRRA